MTGNIVPDCMNMEMTENSSSSKLIFLLNIKILRS